MRGSRRGVGRSGRTRGPGRGRGNLVGLAGEGVALDRDVMGAEGVASDRRGEVEQEQRQGRESAAVDSCVRAVDAAGASSTACRRTGR